MRATTLIGGTALALALAFAAGWWGGSASHKVEAARGVVAASEQLRTEEHQHATVTIKSLDSYGAKVQVQHLRALDARSDLERVRQSLEAIAATPASPAASASCGADPRLLAGLAELLNEGAGLVEEGARVADELRAQRDALSLQTNHTNTSEP